MLGIVTGLIVVGVVVGIRLAGRKQKAFVPVKK